MTEETAPILISQEDTSMIKSPYIDRLANIQYQKNAEKKALAENKKRIKEEEKLARAKLQPYWQVGLFLRNHFPDAFSESELAELPQNEFKGLLKQARSWLWRKATLYFGGLMASLGSLAGFFSSVIWEGYSPFLPLALLLVGIVGLVFFTVTTIITAKILLNKAFKSEYDNF